MDRREKLLSDLDISGSAGVEIGPLNRPVVSKTEGKIFYVDHADTPSLREKYAGHASVKVDEIAEIDAVWGKQSLQECLNGRQFDYVIASHVIEHVPDLITWLEEIESILKPNGTLRVVVPDRRFTFDYLRRETRLCDVANAYVLKARTPLPIAILDHITSVRQVDLQAAWEGTLSSDLPRLPGHDLSRGIVVARDQIANGTYHDVHCWVFTPRSFAELFREAAADGLIQFACEALYDTEPGQLEFVVILRTCPDREQIVESWRRTATSIADASAANDGGRSNRSAADLAAPDEVASLRFILAQKEEELLKAKQTLESVLNSRSWKLTEPLRSLKHTLRG